MPAAAYSGGIIWITIFWRSKWRAVIWGRVTIPIFFAAIGRSITVISIWTPTCTK
jgi:hypothetical protein